MNTFPRAAAHGYTRNREVYRWFRLPETLSTHLRVGSTISKPIQPTELLYIYSYQDHFSLPMVSAAVRKNACGATKHCCGEPGHLKREMFVRYTEINVTFKGEITFSHF